MCLCYLHVILPLRAPGKLRPDDRQGSPFWTSGLLLLSSILQNNIDICVFIHSILPSMYKSHSLQKSPRVQRSDLCALRIAFKDKFTDKLSCARRILNTPTGMARGKVQPFDSSMADKWSTAASNIG
jgi:hypothetical protein